MPVLDYLIGGGSTTVILSGITAVAAKYLKHATGALIRDITDVALKDLKDDVAGLTVKLAAESGGNSNGIRQKLNEVSTAVQAVQVDLAHVKGKLEGAEGAKS